MARSSRFLPAIVAVSILILPLVARGETVVPGGQVSGTWTRDGNPYRIAASCTVATGQMLTIGPGVDVLFSLGFPHPDTVRMGRLVVRGRIFAVGSEADSIHFRPDPANRDHLPAGAIHVVGDDTCIIEYARVTGCVESFTVRRARLKLRHVDITGTNANGAIAVSDTAHVTLDSCALVGNLGSSGVMGGGLAAIGGSRVELTACRIANNGPAWDGGGVYIEDADVSLVSCIIANNRTLVHDPEDEMPHTPYRGGGIAIRGGARVRIANCTIANNDAQIGGALYVTDERAYSENGAETRVTIGSTISWGNSPTQFAIDGGTTVASTVAVSFSIIDNSLPVESRLPGSGNLLVDPLFADTLTYTLQPTSPAIDAGDPSSPLDPDGTRADMGAIPFDHDAPVAIVLESAPPPAFALSQNIPNPFNPSTTIRFSIPEAAHVRLAIHDATGRRVRVLIDEPMDKGNHEAVWNGTNAAGRQCASGLYVYLLTADEYRKARRMILVR